jgi:hypothetical protein
MKRHICQLCLLAATMMAAPVAFSETSIVKCIDDAGRVTLTDRACETGATTVRMAGEPANDGVTRASQRIHVPVTRVASRPLASDIATLKAARAQFVLSDVRSTPALAGLD